MGTRTDGGDGDMSIPRKSGPRPLFLGFSVVAVVALAALIIAWWPGSTQPVSAGPTAGLDLSIGVGAECDSTAGPAKCTFDPGATFTVDFKANALPGGFGYAGYDASIDYSGVTLVDGSLVQQGAGAWPACTFPASDTATAGHVAGACAFGIGAAPSTYVGVLLRFDLQCPASPGTGSVTLNNGPQGPSDLVDESLTPHGEAQGTEALTINCGGGGGETPPGPTNTPPAGPTNTPPGPTNTPPTGPTNTPVPPTATRTPSGAQPTPTTAAAAPTATALPALAKTGSGGDSDQAGQDRLRLWLAIGGLLGLAGAAGALSWTFARDRR